MTDAKEQDVQTETSLTVGKLLQEAREAKKLSIAEVSAQIRLVRGNIHALETGQWDQLHGRPYARGYFTSYVKFLGLPEEDMLAKFNLEYTMSSAEKPLPNNVARIIETKGFPWLKLLLVIILVAMTWFAYQQWQNVEAVSVVETNNDLVEKSLSDTKTETDDLNLDNSFSNSIVEPIASEYLSPTNNSDMEEVVVTAQQLEEISNEVASQVGEASSSDLESSSTVETKVDIQTVSETRIELLFTQDCWVNITDMKGQALVNKLMKANTSANVKGMPPLSISIGRASATEIKVNDVAFDLTPYVRGDVARFTLGGEA